MEATVFDDFYSTIKISNDENHQLLLCSQLYGTHFSIFGKFTFDKIDKGNKTAEILQVGTKNI